MSNKDDGGPAFPRPYSRHERSTETWPGQNGMTLRDYFAGQALIGLLARPPKSSGLMAGKPTTTAELAYLIADDMLKSR